MPVQPGFTPPNRSGLIVENRFEITELIGAGGMASVYKAKHREIDLHVAVKILHSEDLSPKEVERLKREARALNTLFHPNIVKAYSFGFIDSGEPYLILDLLEGHSLEVVIEREKPMKPEWLAEAAKQICRGLACAHDAGLIHRDLKPSNVMIVTPQEGGVFVKLLDFGIARSQNHNDTKLTMQGEIFGSPLYMAPETIQGKEIDARADIYAVGCLMYEALTGMPPHMGSSVIVTFMKHLQDKPKSMDAMMPGLNIPYDLEKVVMKCMEKNPDNRYQTALELCDALEQCNLQPDAGPVW